MQARPRQGDAAALLAPYTLCALLDGAARMRASAPALGDSSGAQVLTFAALSARVDAMAALLAATGLQPGETVLVIAAPRAESVVALLAAARLGADAALAPLDLAAPALALLAHRTGAVAILACARYGELAPLETAFAAAPLSSTVRLVGVVCGEVPDGAADLTAQACDGAGAPPRLPRETSRLITFERQERALMPVWHGQATLVAAAMTLIGRARIGAGTPILATIAPASFAGLVCGPLAMLLSGAALHCHGPFESTALLRQLDAAGPAQLLAPERVASHFAGIKLAGLLALSRWRADGSDFAPPHALAGAAPICDLHAFGERALVAEPRDAQGRACAILDQPHLIEIGGARLVSVQAYGSHGDGLGFSGAGVSAAEG